MVGFAKHTVEVFILILSSNCVAAFVAHWTGGKMKKVGVLFAAVMLAACGGKESGNNEVANVSLDDNISKVSYSLGYLAANELLNSGEEFNAEAFLGGFTHGMKNVDEKKLRLTEEQMHEAIAEYQQAKMTEMLAAQEKQQAQNAELEAQGQEFLAENAKKEGVTVLESGLQYEVLVEGKGGAKPTATDTVKTHYHGTLVDGTVFDSSVDRGEPVEFPVNGVIDGWQEALQLMSVGDKWRLVIPSDLAYGEHGAGGMIGPNATLVFEVELLEIVE